MKRIKQYLLMAVMIVTLSACGGGGSDTPAQNQNPAPKSDANLALSVNGGLAASDVSDANAVIDEDTATAWEPAGAGDSITIFLAEESAIRNLTFHAEGLHSSNFYHFEVSDDGINYVSVLGLCQSLFVNERVFTCDLNRSISSVRLTVLGNIDEVKVFEIEALNRIKTNAEIFAYSIGADSSTTAIALFWDSPFRISGITGYEVFRNGALVFSTDDPDEDAFLDTGLSPAQSYSYEISILGDSTELLRSAPVILETAPIATEAPAAPRMLRVSERDQTALEITWDAGASDENGYRIIRDGVEIAVVDFYEVYFEDEGLTPNTSYTYEVIAFNNAGSSAASSVTVTTLKPEDYPLVPPTNVNASASENSITVTFSQANPANEPDGYAIFLNSSFFANKVCEGATITECTVSGLESGQSYRLRVVSFIDTGPRDTMVSTPVEIRVETL